MEGGQESDTPPASVPWAAPEGQETSQEEALPLDSPQRTPQERPLLQSSGRGRGLTTTPRPTSACQMEERTTRRQRR